jgi:hypothetical protein
MQTLENAKQLVHMPHVETRTIVPYEYFYLIIFLLTAAYLDLGPRPLSRELNGIGKQIHKNYPQHGAISVTHRKRADLPGNVPSARVLRELRDDLGDKHSGPRRLYWSQRPILEKPNRSSIRVPIVLAASRIFSGND